MIIDNPTCADPSWVLFTDVVATETEGIYCPVSMVVDALRRDEEMGIWMHKYPFLKYAAQHWGDHARGGPEEKVKERDLKF
jgi:hypothetical protein